MVLENSTENFFIIMEKNSENQIQQNDPAEIFLLDAESEMLTDPPADPRTRKSNEPQEPVTSPSVGQPCVISTGAHQGQMTVQLENNSPAGAYLTHSFHPHHTFMPQHTLAPPSPHQPYVHHQFQPPRNNYYGSPQTPSYKLEECITSLQETVLKMAEKVTKMFSTVQYLEESNLKLKRIIEDSREENRKHNF